MVKLIKKGWMEHLKAYQDHVIDQAITVLSAGHDVKCLVATPKVLEALANRLEAGGSRLREAGITGIFAGGTEFTTQWNRAPEGYRLQPYECDPEVARFPVKYLVPKYQ